MKPLKLRLYTYILLLFYLTHDLIFSIIRINCGGGGRADA